MAKFELKILDFFNIQKVEIKKDKYYTDIIKL